MRVLDGSLRYESIVRHFRGDDPIEHAGDAVAVEAPLQIAIAWSLRGRKIQRDVAITMRTPGKSCGGSESGGDCKSGGGGESGGACENSGAKYCSDDELAVGYLASEGILTSPSAVLSVNSDGERSVVHVSDDVPVDLMRTRRLTLANASCGVCGKQDAADLERPLENVQTIEGFDEAFRVSSAAVMALPDELRRRQSLFAKTGGCHGCAFVSQQGDWQVREDVGRHNALDKLIGAVWMQARGTPTDAPPVLSGSILVLSGRVSFEMVQKSLVVGVPILVAVGAPTTAAFDLSKRFGQTLIGFVDSQRINVYTHAERILS
ncbi:MAG: formate dehydrogenase accessory sulfurtransferase FdhD [Planctomycetota bacterium]